MWTLIVGSIIGCVFGLAVDNYIDTWKENH